MRAGLFKGLAGLTLALLAGTVLAQGATPGGAASLPLLIGQGGSGTSYSVPIQTLLFFTALSFLPALLLMMTGFTRIVIVLSLMRQAIGAQAAPPNQVIVGLSLFLTLFVMGPTLDKVYKDAYEPFAASQISFSEALDKGQAPMRAFMLKQTRQSDLGLFTRLARLEGDVKPETVPLRVLVPAFVTS
ncbi:MAG TPA: flagellar biosynthetic protein FliP, partial [Aquabacterium sp.]|nr:flagellar biosynthetic protein FliP [Aquabacterium sp.]